MSAPIRTVVADDEPLARRMLRGLLAKDAQLTIVGEARDGVEAEDMVRRLAPDLLVLDGFVPNLTSDVAYLHPNQEIITGREATRTFLKTVYAQPKSVSTVLHRVAGQASADGSLATRSAGSTRPPRRRTRRR